LNITSTTRKNDVRVLFCRDSFANALIQFFSNNLGEASYTRSMPFPLCRAADGAYDFLVVEIVERNLHWIVDTAPAIPAPLRARTWRQVEGEEKEALNGPEREVDMLELWNGAEQLPDGSVIAFAHEPSDDEQEGQGLKVYGCFDPMYLLRREEIRIFPVLEVLEGKDGVEVLILEAFPIIEPELAERVKKAEWAPQTERAEKAEWVLQADNGFSFWIDYDFLSKGEYQIRILLALHNTTGSEEYNWAGLSEPLIFTNSIG
jgi:hypothetical protein